MKVSATIAAVALLVAGCGRAPVATQPPEASIRADWLTNFDEARERAQAEHKLLLIDFTGSDWCPPCKLLNRQVFSRAQFAKYAEANLVLLEVDFPRTHQLPPEQQAANELLAQQFGIEGFPTVVVLDPSGQKVLGQLGYMRGGPEAFLAALEKLRR